MAKLIYAAITSLDGYTADKHGNFDWAEPDPEVHSFVNDLQRPVGTYLFGRRMYEVLVAWESMDVSGQPAYVRDFAESWRAAEKIVYSSTLDKTSSAKTRIERNFDYAAIWQMKTRADRDIAIGGPQLASHALKAGMVDEIHLIINPIIVGGGNQALPDDVRLHLELIDERSFANGVVHLHYRTKSES